MDERVTPGKSIRTEPRNDGARGDERIRTDALGDMVFVIYGTALSYGIDLDAVVAEIHRSNMTKERVPGMEYPSKCVVKGADFSPPNLAPLLAERRDV